ncbi:MAG: hypothetical protein GPJ54_13500 [Candidatus Heimdallarchaeota archaeon]|nr:hypothetical protein [Candidatus Heimdallarchaeota archaeon]
MHCKNCRAYFVRFPCPECGQQEVELPSKPTESELLAITIQEESLQKPSELKGGSAVNPITNTPDDPSLVKPSELNPEKLIDPNDPYNEKENSETLMKPSELKGRSSVNLSSELVRTTSKVKITSANLKLQPVKETIGDRKQTRHKLSKPQQLEGESDEEYKKRVRNTLLEVMMLLEKLIDDE